MCYRGLKGISLRVCVRTAAGALNLPSRLEARSWRKRKLRVRKCHAYISKSLPRGFFPLLPETEPIVSFLHASRVLLVSVFEDPRIFSRSQSRRLMEISMQILSKENTGAKILCLKERLHAPFHVSGFFNVICIWFLVTEKMMLLISQYW